MRAGLKASYSWLTQDNMDAITGVSNPSLEREHLIGL